MQSSERNGRKYNVTLARLIQTVVGMSEKQQLIMLRLAEELLYRQKNPGRTKTTPESSNRQASPPRKPSSIIVNFAAGNRFYTDYIEAINIRGVFIGTREQFKIGEELALAFSHPKFPDIFRVYGSITFITNDGIGVEFKNLSPPQRERIKALVEWMHVPQA
jgi:Tfp pilus assembly protein PilZ